MSGTAGQFLQPLLGSWLPWLYSSSYWWTAFGFLGNAMFSSRFVLQWLASEKRQQVVIPASFWHLSLWGSIINLVYALHIDSAPIIFGIVALPFLYARNLILLYRRPASERRVESKRPARPGAVPAPAL